MWRAGHPSRTEQTAALSEIKGEPYAPANVLALFELFRHQSCEVLLFLKHLRRVSVFLRREGEEAPQLLYRSTLSLPQARGL
jgi:hypothetical protein